MILKSFLLILIFLFLVIPIQYLFTPVKINNGCFIYFPTRISTHSDNIKVEPSWLIDVPTVPTISTDGNLIILSANAGRIRYGGCVTFVTVFPQDMPTVIKKGVAKNPTISIHLNLWCVFDDGSQTAAYSADVPNPYERVSVIDCPLSNFARHELWKQNRRLRVFLIKRQQHNQSIPLARAFITSPEHVPQRSKSDDVILTLCTSPLRNSFRFLPQWIEYHRQIGFRKFIIYNTSDTKQELQRIIDVYAKESPELIDIVQWNFDHLGLKDWQPRRYFQVESIHDCLFRYGDYTDWLSIIDLDEYIVPLPPYTRVDEYLRMNFKREEIGSIVLQSFFFCDASPKSLNITDSLVIEQFTTRASQSAKYMRQKYLCRPRFIQNLGIHRQYYGLPSRKPAEKYLMFAHYVSMDRPRKFPECAVNRTVEDTRIRDLFAEKIRAGLSKLDISSSER